MYATEEIRVYTRMLRILLKFFKGPECFASGTQNFNNYLVVEET